MSVESALLFLRELKNNKEFCQKVAEIENKEKRREYIASKGYFFTHEEFVNAKKGLSENELSLIEDINYFRSDKRKAGMEMCCCCSVGGNVNS